MGTSAEPVPVKSIRLLLSEVDLGTEINRYEFTVAAARRAREIHALTADVEERSQQKSLLRAVRQIITGESTIVKPDEE